MAKCVHCGSTLSSNSLLCEFCGGDNSAVDNKEIKSAKKRISKASQQLFEAIKIGSSTKLKTAIEKGAMIDEPNEYGKTPLNFTAELRNFELFKELIKAGASLSGRTNRMQLGLITKLAGSASLACSIPQRSRSS